MSLPEAQETDDSRAKRWLFPSSESAQAIANVLVNWLKARTRTFAGVGAAKQTMHHVFALPFFQIKRACQAHGCIV